MDRSSIAPDLKLRAARDEVAMGHADRELLVVTGSEVGARTGSPESMLIDQLLHQQTWNRLTRV